jgi:glycosyltransferase involved in cell wall biosynthesis
LIYDATPLSPAFTINLQQRIPILPTNTALLIAQTEHDFCGTTLNKMIKQRSYYNAGVGKPEEFLGGASQTRRTSILKVALVTNHPPPFRVPIYQRIAETSDIDLHAVFCSRREPNRQWELPAMKFNHVFLKERFVTRGSNFIHNNPDVFAALKRLSPHVIITTGFNPTFLYAFLYAQATGTAHVPMTDGTEESERALSRFHRTMRRLVYTRSRAFIAASHGGLRLYRSYGVETERCFQSCLCIDNDAFESMPALDDRPFDLIFCSRIVPEKNPLFALQVATALAARLHRKVRILFVGVGEQEDEVKAEAARVSPLVDAVFTGHAAQTELPSLYQSARLFLFPTQHDVWGVVANEACAAGLPVIVSPHAGVAGELVLDGENGFICPLDAELWAERAAMLLNSENAYRRAAERSRALVSRYTFDHAANGVVAACRFAAGEHRRARIGHAGSRTG